MAQSILRVGDVVRAVVFATPAFGIFLRHENGIVDVIILVKITEVSWGEVKSPAEFTSEGEIFNVKILKVIDENNALGYDLQKI